VVTQSPEFFETTKTGEVLSRLTTDTTLIQTLVGTSISMALRNALLFLGGMSMLFITSAKLTSIIIVMLAAVVLPIVFYGRRVRKLSRASQDRVADAAAMAGEILNAMPTVQAFTHEEIEARRFGDSVERAFQTAMDRIRARSLLTVVAILLVFGAIVFVLWLGAHAVMQGSMSGGELGQFILYASLVAGSLGALSEVMGDTQRAAGATERLLDLWRPSLRCSRCCCRKNCRRAPPMAPRCRSRGWTSTIPRAPAALRCRAFRWTCVQEKRSPWSVRRGPARPRCSSCCCASTIRSRAASGSMAWTSAT